ncbi:ankyrin repeat-containing domain protein [Nemania abortiva]|nr:ankyrin repeat-containing domain protein [Nemania abortiva]
MEELKGEFGRAIIEGDARAVDILVQRLDVNAPLRGRGGQTALQAAVSNGYLEIINALLGCGADVNAAPAERGGRTALQAASEREDVEIVKELIDAGAEVNGPPAKDGGRTALQAAAEKGSLQIIEYLLAKGADINAPAAKYGGRTALQAAAGREATSGDTTRKENSLDLVKLLLDHGADVNAPAAEGGGKTALQAAADKRSLDIIRLLAYPPHPPNASIISPISINGNTLSRETKVVKTGTICVTDFIPILVQTKKPMTTIQKGQLALLKLEVQIHLSNLTYRCRSRMADFTSTLFENIRELDFIAYADVYQQLFKISPHLKRTSNLSQRIELLFHKGVNPESSNVTAAVAKTARVEASDLEIGRQIGRQTVRLVVQSQYLADLAMIDAVEIIQEAGAGSIKINVVPKVRDEGKAGTERLCVADSPMVWSQSE